MNRGEVLWLTFSFFAASIGGLLILISESRDPVDRISDNSNEQVVLVASQQPAKRPVASYAVDYSSGITADQIQAVEATSVAVVEKRLQDYPGFRSDSNADENQFQDEENSRETMIAECMLVQGFLYEPAPSVVVEISAESDFQEVANQFVDPNANYINSLSPFEREAYFLALVGVADPDVLEASSLPDFSVGGGCTGEALREIPGVYAAKNQLRDAIDAMQASADTDPALLEANRQWSQCMQTRGFDFSSPEAVPAMLDDYLLDSAGDVDKSDEYYQQVVSTSQQCEQLIAPILNDIRNKYEQKFVEDNQEILNQYSG